METHRLLWQLLSVTFSIRVQLTVFLPDGSMESTWINKSLYRHKIYTVLQQQYCDIDLLKRQQHGFAAVMSASEKPSYPHTQVFQESL